MLKNFKVISLEWATERNGIFLRILILFREKFVRLGMMNNESLVVAPNNSATE